MDFFDRFQLVYIIGFWSIFLFRTFYLRIMHGVKTISLGVGKRGWNAVLEMSFLIGLILWTTEVVRNVLDLNWYLFPEILTTRIFEAIIAKIIAMLLLVFGIVFFLFSLRDFGKSWRVGIDHRSPGDFISTGVFRISRNPIFLFIDLYFLGTFLINGTLIFLFFFVLVVIGLQYQIFQEEKFLEALYGKRYLDYRNEVGRYLTLHCDSFRKV